MRIKGRQRIGNINIGFDIKIFSCHNVLRDCVQNLENLSELYYNLSISPPTNMAFPTKHTNKNNNNKSEV